MKRLLLIFFVGLCFSACSTATQEPDTFTAALWNVQTLFDGHETGNEFRDFREAAGWTAEKYAARITAISQAITQMIPAGSHPPALIGFNEIENLAVLADLAGGSLARYGYKWAAFSALPGAPFGIGFISRYPITDVRAHSITVERGTAPRPLLEVRVEPRGSPEGEALVFLLSHWKSKLGNETEVLRRASARVVQRRLRELRESEPETPVIVMGDLNENHDEFFRQSGKGLKFFSLLPDDPAVAELALQLPAGERDFLILSAEKPPRSLLDCIPALYTPWGNEKHGGSYFFRGGWETIDHFLLSDALFKGAGWNFADSLVLNHEPFITSVGAPNSYIPRSGRGLSDHLPLLLFLEYSQ
jgi:endonuclease/exonuclease/phosphatase family metal-dependent hydrolase